MIGQTPILSISFYLLISCLFGVIVLVQCPSPVIHRLSILFFFCFLAVPSPLSCSYPCLFFSCPSDVLFSVQPLSSLCPVILTLFYLCHLLDLSSPVISFSLLSPCSCPMAVPSVRSCVSVLFLCLFNHCSWSLVVLSVRTSVPVLFQFLLLTTGCPVC
jgi:hypothetical protein